MKTSIHLMVSALLMIGATQVYAACSDVGRGEFEAAVRQGVIETNGFGFHMPMWVSMVDQTGKICHVYATDGNNDISGENASNSVWLGSRVISAQKANTANAFSVDELSISTGFIYARVVPNGSLYGLQHSIRWMPAWLMPGRL